MASVLAGPATTSERICLARSPGDVKEVGIRKTLGSRNRQIFFQFLFEMFAMMLISLTLALLLSNVIADQIWGLFGVSFFIQDISIINLIPFLIIFICGCTIVAGLLPALYTWKFQPISILNNKYSLKGFGWMQKIFTIGQYTFSIAVLITGLVFARNSDYMSSLASSSRGSSAVAGLAEGGWEAAALGRD